MSDERWMGVLLVAVFLIWAAGRARHGWRRAGAVIDASRDDWMDVADAVQAEDLLTCEELWSLPVVDEHTWGQR